LNLERRRRFEHCEVPAKPNDLNALQKLLFYLASSRFPFLSLVPVPPLSLVPVPPGWRPFIGWVSGLALIYTFLIQPLFLWINSIYNLTPTPPPQLNDDMLFNIVLAMLGMAGLRTYEKQKGLTK
jgi:hypothetical protein